jgi:hypothetical protein
MSAAGKYLHRANPKKSSASPKVDTPVIRHPQVFPVFHYPHPRYIPVILGFPQEYPL